MPFSLSKVTYRSQNLCESCLISISCFKLYFSLFVRKKIRRHEKRWNSWHEKPRDRERRNDCTPSRRTNSTLTLKVCTLLCQHQKFSQAFAVFYSQGLFFLKKDQALLSSNLFTIVKTGKEKLGVNRHWGQFFKKLRE